MKKKYLFLLIIFAAVTGCMKSNPSDITGLNVTIPQGNFVGQFTLIHKSSQTSKLDTTTAVITLSLSGTNFSVGGDTTKIQAPSNGTFTNSDQIITFTDVTLTKRTPANTPKKHLNGTFLYTYTGSNLKIRGSSDTLSYAYDLNSF